LKKIEIVSGFAIVRYGAAGNAEVIVRNGYTGDASAVVRNRRPPSSNSDEATSYGREICLV
jgi:hypothetical protein